MCITDITFSFMQLSWL